MRIAASAPTRIDLAGGTIDIWPLYLFHEGATTLNAAISLRAHVDIESRADGIELRSIDGSKVVTARHWSELHADSDLPLLSLAARHYRLDAATVTTRGESPTGAGIAGSSALSIALCGALARWTKASENPDDVMNVAMNVECQTIRVPTGVQDYRPAMYRGISAIELRADAVERVGLHVSTAELERRIVLAYTGAPRNSGTNNWTIFKRHMDGDADVSAAFNRIRDTAAAMRAAIERGNWDAVGRHIADEWDNRKRLAPGVTTPAIDRLMTDAQAAGAVASKVCGAGGGGCLFCYGPPEARNGIVQALTQGGARVLDYRFETSGLRIEQSRVMKLPMLSTDAKVAEIKRLYYQTTKATIQQDLARALDLLKSMTNEEERERAAVYMDGLAQMRSDWARELKPSKGKPRGRSRS